MGNRILKESICMSPEINALTWFEEVLFYRLMPCGGFACLAQPDPHDVK